MSRGGKGGSQTTQVTIPDWVRQAADLPGEPLF